MADRVRFEDGRLKDVESSMRSGVGLTIIKDGRLGSAYTRNLRDRQELLELALAALAGGVEADYELAPAADLPELGAVTQEHDQTVGWTFLSVAVLTGWKAHPTRRIGRVILAQLLDTCDANVENLDSAALVDEGTR